MRSVINSTANVTTIAMINRSVATAVVGVDAMRALPRHLRLYHAAPARHGWALFAARKQLAGKQLPSQCDVLWREWPVADL